MKIRYYAAILTLLHCVYANADEPAPLTQKTNQTSTMSSSTPAPTTKYYDNNSHGKFGAGIIIGEPIGASVKYWLNDTLAVDGAAGWSTHDNTDFYLHGDLLLHKFDLIPVPSGRLPVYVGAGGLVRFRNGNHDNQFGIRVPVGVSYMFDNAPLDIFAEIGPALDVAPSVKGEVTGGIGIRYWF